MFHGHDRGKYSHYIPDGLPRMVLVDDDVVGKLVERTFGSPFSLFSLPTPFLPSVEVQNDTE